MLHVEFEDLIITIQVNSLGHTGCDLSVHIQFRDGFENDGNVAGPEVADTIVDNVFTGEKSASLNGSFNDGIRIQTNMAPVKQAV